MLTFVRETDGEPSSEDDFVDDGSESDSPHRVVTPPHLAKVHL